MTKTIDLNTTSSMYYFNTITSFRSTGEGDFLALAVTASWFKMTRQYELFDSEIEVSKPLDYEIIRSRDNIGDAQVVFIPGKAQASSQNDRQMAHSQYRDEIIIPKIEGGLLCAVDSQNTHNDIKVRFQSPYGPVADRISGKNQLVLKVAITDYPSYREDRELSKEHVRQLKRRGRRELNDPFAYFASPIGATALIFTSDSKLVLGRRENDTFHDYINGAAGMLDYVELDQLDAAAHAARESKEEFGIEQDEMFNSSLVAIARDLQTGNTEMVYTLRTSLPSEYFTSNQWIERIARQDHTPEHKAPLEVLADTHDINRLIETHITPSGLHVPGIVFGSEAGLKQIRQSDFAA